MPSAWCRRHGGSDQHPRRRALGGARWRVRGEVEVDEAELAGTIDGTLVAHGTLVVRASGKLLGAARCRRLQVEDGGQISGRIEMMTDGASRVDTVSRVGEAPKPLNDKPAPVPPAPVAAN